MKIGVAGPVSLRMLARHVKAGEELPAGYEFPPMATWVEELMRRGHQVAMFTLAPEAAAPRCWRGPQLAIHVGRYRARHRARDLFAQERRDLMAAMLADPCDILHAHWTYEFAWAALDTGLPTLITAHDAPLSIFRIHRDPYRFLRLLMACKVARRAPHLSAVSAYVAEHFQRVLGYRRPTAVVPNGVTDPTVELGWKRLLASPSSRHPPCLASVLTGFAGRKNGPVALLAFAQLRQRFPGATLLAFGPGYAPGEEAQRWALRHGVAQGVQFCGWVEHGPMLRRLAQEVDILLHPALEESFGMAVAEAMALGIPVIGGIRSGAVPELLERGRAGMLVDIRSPRCVAEAVEKLAGDDGLRDRIRREAFSTVLRRFRLPAVFDQYESLYREILRPQRQALLPLAA